jgi:hypothetical protein
METILMPRRRSAKTLVTAIREGREDFDSALEHHVNENYAGPLGVPSLKTVHVALCHASIGEGDKPIELADGCMTAAQVIEEFGLHLFVPLVNDRNGQVTCAVGGTVRFYGQICRVIGRREVTMLAMPREDDFELFLESPEGKPMYFVGESMVASVTDDDNS